MRAWLYDLLTLDPELQTIMGYTPVQMLRQVMPRQSRDNINITKPFLIFGLGNNTNENLAEDTDHEANRQFFQIWVHDEGGDYDLIDRIVARVKALLQNATSPQDKVTLVIWLETSQEFDNETYGTLFRYIRFQAIISEGRSAA